eukprot:4699161-Amphidinium_carterae.1
MEGFGMVQRKANKTEHEKTRLALAESMCRGGVETLSTFLKNGLVQTTRRAGLFPSSRKHGTVTTLTRRRTSH